MRNKANLRKKKLQELHRRSLIEKLEERRLLVSDWLNPIRPNDVNNDLHLNSMDALVVINSLNRDGQRELSAKRPALAPFMDTNGDRFVNAMDALRVINHLNSSVAKDQVTERIEGEAASHPAGFISIPMVQLPGTAGQVVPLATSLSIGREEFNELGIFVAEDSLGRVDGILPGEPGYAEAVFNSSQRRVLYSRFNTLRMSSDSNLPAASFAHVYVLQSTSDNSDPSQHLRARQVSTNLMRVGWEEHISPFGGWTQVGDRGYDDATVDFQIGEPFDGNVEPTIRAIPNQSINELSALTVNAFAVDADMPDDVITYSLDFAPVGAAIDPVSGRITWTPTEVQGPGNFEFLVRATDAAGAFDTESFFVTVLEVNQSPVLQAIPNLTGRPGQLVTFQAIATDADLPLQQLTYSLLPGSPTGATVNPTTGEFRWQISDSQASGSYPVTIRVSDNGSPVLSNTKSFSVSVGCSFDDTLSGWTVFESGGTNLGKGKVTTNGCAATIREGDSFVVGLQKKLVTPIEPSAIEIVFSNPRFDENDPHFINDAFEIAILDEFGRSISGNFAANRQASINITESISSVYGPSIELNAGKAIIGISDFAPGTPFSVILRMLNNDSDAMSSVVINSVRMIPSSTPSKLSASSGLGSDSQIVMETPVTTSPGLAVVTSATNGEFRSAPSFSEQRDIVPTLEWRKSEFHELPGHKQVIASPAVADINVDGVPDVVFVTYDLDRSFSTNDGVIRAISGDDGRELLSITNPDFRVNIFAGVALGDIDSDGRIDIVTHGGKGVIAFNNDGTLKWNESHWIAYGTGTVAIANLDLEGDPEIVVGGSVVLRSDGSLWANSYIDGGLSSAPIVSDVDMDGFPDLIGSVTKTHSGSSFSNPAEGFSNAVFTAIANLDEDIYPEIVVAEDWASGQLSARNHDGSLHWGPVKIPGGGAGVPLIADMDGDGMPEIGVAGRSNYVVFEHDGSLKWQTSTQDFSSAATSSTAFDFDGDGRYEIVYADEVYLRILDGTDGSTLFITPNSSGTLIEHPIVVDVDGDGKAEIVVGANGAQNGIAVFGDDANWVDTRKIWNQHSYHITNVNDDGSIPVNEANGWEVYNSYRANVPTGQVKFGKPIISVTAPKGNFLPGETVVINGLAIAQGNRSDGTLNSIINVDQEGVAVDVLDVAGTFYSVVQIQAGRNELTFTATDSVGQATSATLVLWGFNSEPEIDLSQYTDTTSSFNGVYGRTSFDEQSKLLYVDLATGNASNFDAQTPLLIGVKNISNPSVTIVGADGVLSDGTPYFDYSQQVPGGRLRPGQTTGFPSISFFNPNREQFDYELVFFSKTNSAPSFTSVPKIEGLVDKEYRYVVTAIDEDGDPLSFQLREAPAGMSINSQTGVVTWTPQAGDVGSPRVSIEVSDPRGGRATQSFTLNVNVPPPNRPPVIISTPKTVVDDPFRRLPANQKELRVTVRDFSDSHSDFEPGFNWIFNPTLGLVRNTLDQDGLPVFVAAPGQGQIKDAHSFSQWYRDVPNINKSFQITLPLERSTTNPSLFTFSDDLFFPINGLGFGNEGRENNFHFTLHADTSFTYQGGEVFEFVGDDDVWVFIDNKLALDLGGIRPAVGGKIFLDNLGLTIGEQYDFDLFFAERQAGSSSFSMTTGLDFVPEQRYQYLVTAMDADTDPLTYKLKLGPSGMVIDPAKGLVAWSPTPDQIGDHEVEVEVSDGRGGIATQKFVICVHPDPMNRAPIIVSDPPTVSSVTTPYSHTVQAVDADSDVLSFRLRSGPAGLSISESTGLLTWNSPALGSHAVKLQVADGRGGFDTQEFELRVAGAGLGTIRGNVSRDFGTPNYQSADGAILLVTANGLENYVGPVLRDAGFEVFVTQMRPNGIVDAFTAHSEIDQVWIWNDEFAIGNGLDDIPADPTLSFTTADLEQLREFQESRGDWIMDGLAWRRNITADEKNLTINQATLLAQAGGGILVGADNGSRIYSSNSITQHVNEVLEFFDFDPFVGTYGIVPPQGVGGELLTKPFTVNPSGLSTSTGTYSEVPNGRQPNGVFLSTAIFGANSGVWFGFEQTSPPLTTDTFNGNTYNSVNHLITTTIVGGGINSDGLAGWTIYLDQNRNGRLDDGERSTVTDANGNYELTGLPAGTYFVAEVQQAGWTQTFPTKAINGPELIVGGSFENATLEQGVSIFWKGSRLEPGWDVIEDSVDVVHRSFFISSTGDYSVDLTGTPGDGAILQAVSTVPGARYRLSFDLAGNPLAAPAIKQLLVSAGSVSRSFEFDVSGFDAQSLVYRRESFEFVASSERTLIVFDSMTPGIGGPVIDSVSLRQLSQAKTHVVELGSNSVVTNVNFGNSKVGSSSSSINFISQPPLTVLSNEAWCYDAIAQTSSSKVTVAYAGVSVPSGMTVHPQLGVVAWQPTSEQIGKHTVILQATDTAGNSATQVFEIEVVLPNTAPVFTVTPSTNAIATRAYESVVAAQDAEGGAISYRLVNGPTGLSLNQRDVPNASGEVLRVERFLAWTPTNEQVGSHTVRIEARDARNAASELEFTIQVAATGSNRLPTITSQARKSTIVDRMYVYAATANDSDSQRLVWSLSQAPTGMEIHPDFGFISWTPTFQQPGDHSITLSVSDGAGGIASQSFTLNVSNEFRNTAPLIVSNPRLYALEGQGYRYDVVSEDEDHDPVRYRLVVAPHGMSIDASRGTIRWTPTNQQFGEHSVVIEGSDPYGAIGTQRFTINVNCVNSPPMIVSVPLTTALTERTYIYPVRATDLESGPLRFKLLSSPTGMSINADTFLIRWNPSTQQLGEHTVTVEVRDEAGAVGLQVYKTVVRSSDEPVDPNNPDGPKLGNRAPLFTSTPVFNAKTSVVYQYTVSAIDPDGDAIAFALQNPPAGMTISASGIITWTPALGTDGTYPITISATDVHDARTNQAFVLNVSAKSAPVITSQPVTNVAAGAIYRYAVRATDADNDPLAYALEGAPDGMSIDRLGLVRWETKQSDLGTKSFTIRVTDSFGQSATQAVSLIVAADTTGPAVSISVFGGRPDRSSGIQVDLGSTYTVQVQATDDVGVVSRSLKVNSIEQPLSSSFAVQLVANQLGIVQLSASARDAAGNETTYNLSITIVDPASVNLIPNDQTAPPRNGGADPNDKSAPFVDITSPELGASVTNVVTIRGTVDDPKDRLWYWRLYYARMDQISTAALDLSDTDWVMIRQGTAEVINGELGQFDPTMLSRDGYVIALVAYDLNGAGEIVGTVVNVEGNLQVGNFRLEFTDVTIPLAGIPITINRVYDTVNANDERDFGFGWSFGVQDPRILEAGAIGQGGGLNFSTDRFIPDKTKVFLTNPEGRRVGFTYKEELVSASLFGGIFRPYFVADPGVYDTLTIDETHVARGGIIGALAQGINPDNYTLTTKSGMKYHYNQIAGLQTITDRNGNVVTFSDTEIRHSLGQTIQLVRDHRGRIREIELPTEGNQTARKLIYTYDANGNLVRFTDQTGLVTRYEYLSSPSHYLDKVYDPLGKKVIEAIYANRRFIGMFDALGNEVGRQTIDTARNRGVVRDANGFETVLIYNDRGNVIEEIDPLGYKTIRRYEDPRNVDLETTIIDRNGNVTNREYDSRGNATRIIERGPQSNPLARPVVTEFTYDSSNNVTSIKNSAGATTAFAFDSSGQVTRIANALAATSGFTYDSQGRRQSFTDFNGNTTRFEYDEACPCGSPSRLINPDGTYQTFEYNDYGQVTAERTFEANGTLIEQKLTEYDAAGKVTREVMGAGNDPLHPPSEIRKFYSGNLLDWEIIVNPVSLNADGSLKESPSTPIAQRKSRITDYVYDAADRLIRQIDANGGVVNFRYDAQGNRLLLQDPVGNITTWVYDGNNRMIEERDPLYWDKYIKANAAEFAGKVGDALLDQVIIANRKASGASLANNQGAPHVRSFGYDPNGNQIEIIDRNNRRREFSYDHAGRMIEERWYAENNGPLVETISFSYDILGNMLTAENSVSKYTYTYDILNRLKSVDNLDSNPDTPHVILYYDYDAQGNVLRTYDDSGVTVESTYDGRNQLATRKWFDAVVPAGQTPDVADARVDFTYNAAGRQKQIRRYSGLTATTKVGTTDTTYDLAGRTNSLIHRNATDALLSSYDYGYDFSGLVIDEQRDHQDPQHRQSITYNYDLTGQLVDAFFSGQDDEHYEYDLNGNRTRSVVGDEIRVYTTGVGNRLLSDSISNYEYDGEGNLVRIYGNLEAITEFEWNSINRLTSLRKVGVHQQAISRDVYGRELITKLIEESGHSQISLRSYNGDSEWQVQVGDQLSRHLKATDPDETLAISKGGLYWALADRQRTSHSFQLGSGTVNIVSLTVYGLADTRAADLEVFFGGRPKLVYSDFIDMRSRIFCPQLGRFISQDSWGFAGRDANLYRYVLNSPTSGVDPSGNTAILEAIGLKIQMLDSPALGVAGFAGGVSYSAFAYLGYFLNTGSQAVATDLLMRDLSQLLSFQWSLSTLNSLAIKPAFIVTGLPIPNPLGLVSTFVTGYSPENALEGARIALLKELKLAGNAAMVSFTSGGKKSVKGPSPNMNNIGGFINGAIMFLRLLKS